ncbi:MAG TPA: hypothetical protein VKU41_24230 [Polyangiaceae bacterium]|nr:hypothetical protein [Polyangiaceae bacterium]
MATTTKSKADVVHLAEQLIAGTDKHLTGVTQVILGGGTYTPEQIAAKLQSLVKLRTDVDQAKAATKARLATEKTDMPALRTFIGAFVSYVKGAFGSAPDVLADFGIHPKVRAPLTVEAKAAAAAKRKATRAARHTMGTKQKKGVKGVVTGVVLTPITAPQPTASEPASPTTPASGTGPTAGTTSPHTA